MVVLARQLRRPDLDRRADFFEEGLGRSRRARLRRVNRQAIRSCSRGGYARRVRGSRRHPPMSGRLILCPRSRSCRRPAQRHSELLRRGSTNDASRRRLVTDAGYARPGTQGSVDGRRIDRRAFTSRARNKRNKRIKSLLCLPLFVYFVYFVALSESGMRGGANGSSSGRNRPRHLLAVLRTFSGFRRSPHHVSTRRDRRGSR